MFTVAPVSVMESTSAVASAPFSGQGDGLYLCLANGQRNPNIAALI